jgi:hypothetical protein
MISFPTSRGVAEHPTDVLPYEVLLWAKEESELKRLTRISALSVEGGISRGYRDGRETEMPTHDVLGIRAEYETRYWEPARTVGSGRIPQLVDYKAHRSESTERRDSETEKPDWADEYLVHFDFDGPGGEIITEIHVADEAKAIKLRTNRDRWSYFGEAERNDWHIVRPEEGEVLVGMVVCFGTASGRNWETKTFGHIKTTSVTGLVMATE